MPQTTPDLAAKFPGYDSQAVNELKKAGFRLNKKYQWLKPSRAYVLTDRDKECILYLIEEWDYDGFVGYIDSNGIAVYYNKQDEIRVNY